MALGIDDADANAGHGNIESVVHVGGGIDRKPSAEHRSIARCRIDWKNQRIGLQSANPDRIETFVKDSEGRQETARGDGQVAIRNVVELRVVHVLVDRATIGPAGWTLKLSL